MVFSEKLKRHRMNAGFTQDELALRLGVTCRTVQNYESGSVYPKKREIYNQLAELFDTDIDYWLTESDGQASTLNRQAAVCKENVLSDVSKLFLDEFLDDEALDQIMRSIQDAYWTAKDQSKKNKDRC